MAYRASLTSKQLNFTYKEYINSGSSMPSGTSIYDYTILKEIGRGAFGKIFLARNSKKQHFAIKLMDLQKINKEINPKIKQIRWRLVRNEPKLMQQCNSPNVLKCFQIFQNESLLALVLQYCNGKTLQQYLDKRLRLKEQQAIKILRQIINGIAELHNHSIIHRDLKADNIMEHQGQYKIIDLGFSKKLDIAHQLAQVKGTTLGTVTTMAPQVLSKSSYGLKADIWSVGIIFFQMVFGVPLYDSVTVRQRLKQFQQKKYFSPDKQLTYNGIQISKQANNFLYRVLQVNTQKRMGWRELLQHPLIKQKEQELGNRFLFKHQLQAPKVDLNKTIHPQREQQEQRDRQDEEFQRSREEKPKEDVKQKEKEKQHQKQKQKYSSILKKRQEQQNKSNEKDIKKQVQQLPSRQFQQRQQIQQKKELIQNRSDFERQQLKPEKQVKQPQIQYKSSPKKFKIDTNYHNKPINNEQQRERQQSFFKSILREQEQLLNSKDKNSFIQPESYVSTNKIPNIRPKQQLKLTRLPLFKKPKNDSHIQDSEQYQWTQQAFLQCQKTQLLYHKIIIQLQHEPINHQQRQIIQFIYLLSARCFNNMSIINHQINFKYNNRSFIQNLSQQVKPLYKNVREKFKNYSKKLTEAQDRLGQKISDFFTKKFNQQEYDKKNKFTTGLQIKDYHKFEQIDYTYLYVAKLLKQIGEGRLKSLLINYDRIMKVKIRELDGETFQNYVNNLIRR